MNTHNTDNCYAMLGLRVNLFFSFPSFGHFIKTFITTTSLYQCITFLETLETIECSLLKTFFYFRNTQSDETFVKTLVEHYSFPSYGSLYATVFWWQSARTNSFRHKTLRNSDTINNQCKII